MKNCKYFANCGNEENCKDCKGFEPVKKVVYFKGAKWFDKVNGNTYNNVKVIDGENISYLGFQYGYGNDYHYRAMEHFDKLYGSGNYKLIELGCEYYKKTVVKNNNF